MSVRSASRRLEIWPRLALAACAAALLVLAAPDTAHAQVDIDYRGLVESDLRLAIPSFPGSDQPEDVPEVYFARTDNTARLTVGLMWEQVRAIADLAVTFSGRSDVEAFSDLHQRAHVDPWYFESDALYIEILDLVFEGVDLRLGRQVIDWGKADIFNPTSVVNPYDLEDPLDFGRKIANEMVVLSISPPWYVDGEELPILDEINLTLVAVPVFRSALLPESAALAFTSPDQFQRFVNSDLLRGLIDVQRHFLDSLGGIVNYDLAVEEPSLEVENIQFGSRFGMSLFGVDFSLMYYRGFDHNVQPRTIEVGKVTLADRAGTQLPYPSDLSDPESLKMALDASAAIFDFEGATVQTDIVLAYPRVHVLGADIATSLDFLGGLGLWAEFAATIHDGAPLDLTIGDFGTCGTLGPDGEPLGEEDDCIEQEHQVDPGWFWKLTAGLDYSFTSWWYANVQYLHGFVDEFGSENLGDYIVAGMDFKAFSEQVLIRLFGIVELDTDPDEASAILYPALTFRFWQNTDLVAGALLHVGDDDTKFGNRTAGPNLVFFKGKYSF